MNPTLERLINPQLLPQKITYAIPKQNSGQRGKVIGLHHPPPPVSSSSPHVCLHFICLCEFFSTNNHVVCSESFPFALWHCLSKYKVKTLERTGILFIKTKVVSSTQGSHLVYRDFKEIVGRQSYSHFLVKRRMFRTQMYDTGRWWVALGGATVRIKPRRDGRHSPRFRKLQVLPLQ